MNKLFFNKEKTIKGQDLFVARVRIIVKRDRQTGTTEFAHYNGLGYRLFIKKNTNTYCDVLTGTQTPLLKESMAEHSLFIVDPKPLAQYAKNLKMNEKEEDVKRYALFVSEHFNRNARHIEAWSEIEEYIDDVHNGSENSYMSL